MRSLDRTTIQNHGIPGTVLMDRAGAGLARIARAMLPDREKKILLIAGRGNNGGDAFVAARYLAAFGYDCTLRLACPANSVKGDALIHLNRMRDESGILPEEISEEKAWDKAVLPAKTGLIIDGILGTGIKGAARDAAGAAIRFINRHVNVCKVAAIDIPSGLNSDTGRAEGDCVHADRTITMALPKPGLVQPCAIDYTGSIDVIDIGIPDELVANTESNLELITAQDIIPLFPRRARDSHKGSFGHLLVIAGSKEYSGAAGMAVRAAGRSGAGLVTAAVPECIREIVASQAPEAMVRACPETKSGSHSPALLNQFEKTFSAYDAVLVGPGMSRDSETEQLIKTVVENSKAPVLLDADGLNAFEHSNPPATRNGREMILTPHPGELARIMKSATSDIQADRFAFAQKACDLTRAVVILKGAGTLVAAPGEKININMTGNPGMSSGGTGDVLAGLTAGFLAQGLSAFNAARAGVFIHGKAAETAVKTTGEPAMLAGDIINAIPGAFLDILPR